MGVSLTTSALASKALANSTRVTTDGLRAAAKSGLAEETKIASEVTGEAKVTKSSASKVWDYSEQFELELENFNPGYKINTSVDHDLYLVQYHSNGEVGTERSLKFWTTTCEANDISTMEEYMNKMALLKKWGKRDHITVAKIPAGTRVKYAIGTAKKQIGPTEFRPGEGLQLLFEYFDENWAFQTERLP